MTKAEIEKLEESIKKAREALAKGLIVDPEAASQLRRMIAYHEDKLKEAK